MAVRLSNEEGEVRFDDTPLAFRDCFLTTKKMVRGRAATQPGGYPAIADEDGSRALTWL